MGHVAIANKLMNLNVVINLVVIKNAKMMSILLLVLKTSRRSWGQGCMTLSGWVNCQWDFQTHVYRTSCGHVQNIFCQAPVSWGQMSWVWFILFGSMPDVLASGAPPERQLRRDASLEMNPS